MDEPSQPFQRPCTDTEWEELAVRLGTQLELAAARNTALRTQNDELRQRLLKLETLLAAAGIPA